MTGRLPGTDQAVLARVVARQDDLETTLIGLRADLDRLARATSALTDTLRKLPTPNSQDGAGETGQRDWLQVTDPALAMDWLLDLTGWWEQIGTVLAFAPHPCWPWHPKAVVAGLAVQAHYRDAYTGDRALAVSDLITRWVPVLTRAATATGADCSAHDHYHHGLAWTVHPDQLPDYATWWATTRTGQPPGLTPHPHTDRGPGPAFTY